MQCTRERRPPAGHRGREAVARALAEDLGPLGDHHRGLLPDDRRRRGPRRPPRRGCARRLGCADGGVLPGRLGRSRRVDRRDDGDEVGPHQAVAAVDGPLASMLDGRAHRAQLPPAPLGRGHPHPALRACRAGPGPDLGHAEDDARSAGAREGGGPGRRRRQPPRQPVRLGDGQGQPPCRPRHRRGRARARLRWPGRASRSSATRVTRWSRPSRPGAELVLLDNMSPDEVGGVCARPVGGPRLVEVSGGVTLETMVACLRRRSASTSSRRAPSPTPPPCSTSAWISRLDVKR